MRALLAGVAWLAILAVVAYFILQYWQSLA